MEKNKRWNKQLQNAVCPPADVTPACLKKPNRPLCIGEKKRGNDGYITADEDPNRNIEE